MVAKSRSKRIAVLAGGTGGHIFPALAVAQEMRERGYQVHWFGTDRGLEARVVPAAGIKLHILDATGIRGKDLRSRSQGVLAALQSTFQAYRILRKLRPACALGMGGYVAGPSGLAVWLTGTPLVIHEQNSVAGTTNRLLQRLASEVLCAYPGAFPGEGQTLVGNPVRQDLLERGIRAEYEYDGNRPLRLLVLGGSQGARAINDVIPQTFSLLGAEFPLQVRHQTGETNLDHVHTAYSQLDGIKAEVFPFIEDMASAYDWADLVLCRAGALTIAELTVMGRPSILVPLPHSIDDHQLHNAEWLSAQNGAVLLPQADLNPTSLSELLGDLVRNPARLAALAHGAEGAAQPEATRAVADICEVRKRGR